MGSELSVSAEEQTSEAEKEEPNRSEESEHPKHKVLFLTEEEAKEPSKVVLWCEGNDLTCVVFR